MAFTQNIIPSPRDAFLKLLMIYIDNPYSLFYNYPEFEGNFIRDYIYKPYAQTSIMISVQYPAIFRKTINFLGNIPHNSDEDIFDDNIIEMIRNFYDNIPLTNSGDPWPFKYIKDNYSKTQLRFLHEMGFDLNLFNEKIERLHSAKILGPEQWAYIISNGYHLCQYSEEYTLDPLSAMAQQFYMIASNYNFKNPSLIDFLTEEELIDALLNDEFCNERMYRYIDNQQAVKGYLDLAIRTDNKYTNFIQTIYRALKGYQLIRESRTNLENVVREIVHIPPNPEEFPKFPGGYEYHQGLKRFTSQGYEL